MFIVHCGSFSGIVAYSCCQVVMTQFHFCLCSTSRLLAPALPAPARFFSLAPAHPLLLTRSCFQVRAIKQITVHEPPNVLTIHLKRFEFGGFGSKISKKVRQWLHDRELKGVLRILLPTQQRGKLGRVCAAGRTVRLKAQLSCCCRAKGGACGKQRGLKERGR